MNVGKHLLIQFIVLCILLVALYFWKCDPNSIEQTPGDEIRAVLKTCGIGECIGIFGVLWMVSCFFHLGCGWTNWIASTLTGFSLFLAGFAMSEYGIFHALITVGCYLFVLTWILSGAVTVWGNLRPLMAWFVLIGIVLVVVGWLGKDSDEPTDTGSFSKMSHEEQIKIIGDHPEARWRLRMEYYGRRNDLFFTFEGRTEEAYEIARLLSVEHEAVDYTVTLLNVPPSHARAVGALDWLDSRRYEKM